jgi:STE24 endopeptidase
MQSDHVTLAFAAALLLSLAVKLWLATRQMRHVAAHRNAVPAAFVGTVTLQAHQRAADYTLAKGRLGLFSTAFASLVLLSWTLLGGLDTLNLWLVDHVLPVWGTMAYQLALLAVFTLIGSLLELPLDAYSTFRVEQRFGFNRMTPKLWLADLAKGAAVGVLIGLPLAAVILWIMGASGGLWWLYAWVTWVGFNLVLMVLYPTVIAPMFNKFTPLQDDSVKERINALLARCGFTSSGLFVMDGSKRSAHGNAYFTGFGKSKRIVFFDTLLERLNISEIEAVLAHELGHFKHRHVVKRIVFTFAMSLGFLWLLAVLMQHDWFYLGLGVDSTASSTAVALLLFFMVLPVFSFLLSPVMSAYSRKHEFEADAYAAQQTAATELVNALVKLYQDNAATLTPDPLHSKFYDSHPPAAVRIAHLQSL